MICELCGKDAHVLAAVNDELVCVNCVPDEFEEWDDES